MLYSSAIFYLIAAMPAVAILCAILFRMIEGE